MLARWCRLRAVIGKVGGLSVFLASDGASEVRIASARVALIMRYCICITVSVILVKDQGA